MGPDDSLERSLEWVWAEFGFFCVLRDDERAVVAVRPGSSFMTDPRIPECLLAAGSVFLLQGTVQRWVTRRDLPISTVVDVLSLYGWSNREAEVLEPCYCRNLPYFSSEWNRTRKRRTLGLYSFSHSVLHPTPRAILHVILSYDLPETSTL